MSEMDSARRIVDALAGRADPLGLRYGDVVAADPLAVSVGGAIVWPVRACRCQVGDRVTMITRQGSQWVAVGVVSPADLCVEGNLDVARDFYVDGTVSVNNGAAEIASTGNATVNDLQVNGTATHSKQLKFANGTALPNAGTSTDFFATGINAFANGGRLAYKGLADMKTWLGLGATTNWAYISGNASSASYVRWRAVNGVVYVQVNMQAGSFGTVTNPSTKSIATVPSGYRPSKQVSSSATANTNNVVSLWVKTDGTVNVGPLGGSINACYGHVTYPLG